MRGIVALAAAAFALSACVTPPASPEVQAAYFGEVPAPPTADQLQGAPLLTNFVWEKIPNGADYTMVYPRDAWAAEVEAVVTLECLVLETRHVACAAGDDGYPQYNFEQAARNLSTQFIMRPLTRDGVPVVGARVKLTVQFRFG